jgi:hypothetical protein
MTLQTIREEVLKTGFDGSLTRQTVDRLINEGLLYTAEIILLPLLEKQGFGYVDTIVGQSAVDLPADFSRNLFFAVNDEGYELSVYSSSSLLNFKLQAITTGGVPETGEIHGVALEGGRLAYAKCPEEIERIYLKYYTAPTPLTQRDHEPTCIPEAHRVPILANYAKWRIFDDIEDGVDGAKVNTDKYKSRYESAVGALEAITTQGQSRPRNRRTFKGWV